MSVLDEIVARKRVDVATRKEARPIERLRSEASPTNRSLVESLRKPGLRFILECKQSSPSEGILRIRFDPAAIADAYRGFADGISVLTDTPYFGGDFSHLRIVRERVDLPILCKDFVLDPYQVVEARAAGADAVLLMLSVLDDIGFRQCAAEASRWNLDVLTEVHDESELARAIGLGAKLIGINNRDLTTLKVDLSTTRRLAPRIPSDRTVVCESGIRSRRDVDAVADCTDAVLVGSHLMKSERLDVAVRELIFGSVKVCGLTAREQIQMAYAAGASWGGLNFAAESPRSIGIDQARAMVADSPLRLVGVFVNDQAERIAALAHELQLAAVQLHGEERPAAIRSLRTQLPAGCEIWKAVRVQKDIPHPDPFAADRLLLDTFAGGQRGGTGQTFDWEMLKAYSDKSRFILAGGIRPENVRDAHAVGCGMLDVNSGVETAPGVKDESLLRQLFAALRGAI